MRTPNHDAISTAHQLFVKYRGRHHRAIEREMRARGFVSFTRRVLYDTRRNGDVIRQGWIKRFFGTRTPPSASPLARKEKEHVSGSALIADGGVRVPPDFQAFLKKVSPHFSWDWEYQKLIYEKLEQITDGTSKRLMIFLPPRHGKSELVTVRYTAWRLK